MELTQAPPSHGALGAYLARKTSAFAAVIVPQPASVLPALPIATNTWPALSAATWGVSAVPGVVCQLALPLTSGAKSAVTAASVPLTDTTQGLGPLQAPLKPANTAPDPAVASSVTDAPSKTSRLQTSPQSMPAGVDVTVPVPDPPRATVSSYLAVQLKLTG